MKTPPRPDEGNGGGVTCDKQVGRPLVNPPVHSAQASTPLRQLEAAPQRLDRHVATLEIIAAWRDELRKRLARAELADANVDIDGLADEVALFKRLCRAIGWTGRKRS